MRKTALFFLAAIGLCALAAPRIAPYSYDHQFRDSPDAPPSSKFLLGTDYLGRDRFSRLLYATRVSALLAPGGALVSISIALIVSCAAGGGGAAVENLLTGATTVCLSMPWIFLFIILRAELPLDTGPVMSVLLTFALMGIAGWAWPSRVFTASLRQFSAAGWIVHARACGFSRWRIARVHMWPHLRSVASVQFSVLVPAYILSEASLGLLGLGVADPLPSWGNMLQELQHPELIRANPLILAPLGLLMVLMLCLENLRNTREMPA